MPRFDLSDVASPALRRRLAGGDLPPKPPAAAPNSSPAPIPLRPPVEKPPHFIELGADEYQKSFGLLLDKIIDGRLLVQGNSGAGKSWTLRKLLEESAGQIQQIILDPEGEFRSLAQLLDYPIIEGDQLQLSSLGTLAHRVREKRLSIVLDLSQLDRDRQMLAVARFVQGLVSTPRELWHPALVVVDEAHLFAPYGGQVQDYRKASIAALVDLMSRGRKRGLAGILATQRLARLSKSVSSEATNFLIGKNTLDLDIRRAAETIGWEARRAFDRLPMLEPGNFVAVGPAFPNSPTVAKIGMVQSHHAGATPHITPPMKGGAELLDLESLQEEEEQAPALPARPLARPREVEPRLSPPREPGRHSDRFWTAEEQKILRDHYETDGPAFCLEKLPTRDLHSIYTQANKLGLHAKPGATRRKDNGYWISQFPDIDAKLTEQWPNLTAKGALKEYATELGLPRWFLSRRIAALGLTKAHSKEPAWTKAELDLLEKVQLHYPELAAREFARYGFHRTGVAIIVRAKRLGLSRRYRETLSARQFAKILGIDDHIVSGWINRGELAAEKRETQRLAQQGGDPWSVTHRAARQFVIDNIENIDIRKVEKFSFVELLTTPAKEESND